MSAADRDQLLDLHRAAVNAWAAAERDGRLWADAYTADDAFTAAVHALTPDAAEGPG